MKFLIDTNVLIALEPVTPSLEPLADLAAEFISLAGEGGHAVVRHPAQRVDDAHDRDEARRTARTVLFRKYRTIGRVRPSRGLIASELGSPPSGSHDWVDHELLTALEAGAVEFLVTEDDGIHRKARRARLGSRVLHVRDAVDMLRTFLDRPPAAPPAVEWVKATEIDERDPIFDSIRSEYPELDEWLSTCRLEERDTAIIRAPDGGYAGISIVAKKAGKFGLPGKFLKVCQFKVDDRFAGRRYGELLLKTLFDYRAQNGYDYAYVTAFEHHESLIRLFTDFGFEPFVARSDRGEVILVKSFRPTREDETGLEPLEYHRSFGPPALLLDPDRIFVVPIQPRYHQMLFPEAEPQLALPIGELDRPFGNALRKAYLSHSRIGMVPPGSTLLFYRSGDWQAVACVGVLEAAVRPEDTDQLVGLVGKRTVYSLDEIKRLAAKPTLALLFRQDRFLVRPIKLAEMLQAQLLLGPPQSITHARSEGFAWLTKRIAG